MSIKWSCFLVAPSAAPQLVTLNDVNSTFISISWIPPPPTQQNGIVRHYEVQVENDASGEVHIMETISSSINIYSLKPFSLYRCRVAAVTVTTGPFSTDLNVTTLQDSM